MKEKNPPKKLLKKIREGMKEGRIFKTEEGICFTVLIPCDLNPLPCFRCGNCGSCKKTITQICEKCKMPFIGPLTLPAYTVWSSTDVETRKKMIKDICESVKDWGRSFFLNAVSIPLTLEEIRFVEKLEGLEVFAFESTHGVNPHKIREVLTIIK